MEKLKGMQAADNETHSRPRRKLVKACRTRLLFHCEALIALSLSCLNYENGCKTFFPFFLLVLRL